MTPEPVTARPYRGISPDERRAQRRSKLVAAGVAVYGERGYRNATVKAVCEAAGLTERYFYESFANSEDLLIACFNAITYAVFHEVQRVAAATPGGQSARSRAMLRAYFSALQREPASARVFLVEIRGVSRAVDKAFDMALQDIGREVAKVVAPRSAPDPLLEAGVIGGVIHIAIRWIEQGYSPDVELVTDAALKLGKVLNSRA